MQPRVALGEVGTPRPARKRVLEDVTNTPPPLAGPTSLGRLAAQAASFAATSVQRFSLKSRQARCVGSNAVALSHLSLRIPPRISGDISGPVVLCHCSWQPGLRGGRRRLCQQDTEDHQEFRLLEVLSSRFMAESGSRAVLVTHEACRQNLEVYFVIQPDSDIAVGYIAFRNFGHQLGASKPLSAITQIYIEPDYRRRGMAAAALRVLLAGREHITVEALAASPDMPPAVSSQMHRLLRRLGFEACGASVEASGEDDSQYVLYSRQKHGGAQAEQIGSENAV